MATEIRIPQLGESISEGVIARWLKRDGDLVQANEPVLEIETDKATMEIAADRAGRLEIAEREGAVVRPGGVVARIHELAAPAPAPTPRPTPSAAAVSAAAPREPEHRIATPASSTERRLAAETPLSPGVRRLVSERSVDANAVAGTGKGGRLTKDDVVRHLAERETMAAPGAPPATSEPAAQALPAPTSDSAEVRRPSAPVSDAGSGQRPFAPISERAEMLPSSSAPPPDAAEPRRSEGDERVRMTRLRRRIADRLVEAQRTAAILTTFNEIDMSDVIAVRRQYRERFRTRHGVDLGLMSLFARAVALALGEIPVVNASIEGDEIVYHRAVHLGIAVATTLGLVVPVIRHADRMSVAQLECAIADVAALARDGKVVPDQLAGGTFTITNGGVFGSLLSTPILNPPQSGILGMHKIQDRPVAVDGQVVIRPMMYVALSYDHRLVDGQQAVTFLVRVKERLEDPVRMLLDV